MKRIIFLLLAVFVLTGFVPAQSYAAPLEENTLEAALSENGMETHIVNPDTVPASVPSFDGRQACINKSDKHEIPIVFFTERLNTGQFYLCEFPLLIKPNKGLSKDTA
jgi:hypothetical protein